jgi:ATP-binding protein involved in chromosome partitioning
MADPVEVSRDDVLRALSMVQVPELGGDLVSRNLVRDVKICGGNVALDLAINLPDGPAKARIEEACRAALLRVPGVTLANVRFAPGPAGPAAPPRSPAGAPQAAAPGGQSALGRVAHIIAVGSGKGGVGKSTVAVNLAVALAQEGRQVGLLDADVYGPSVPMMMGVRHPPAVQDGMMVPLEQYGVKLMSLGFMMPDDSQHVIWRGPMVAGAVGQMLTQCRWEALDYLLVDLPPGTGDAQLTLAQTVPLTGAVVVMTSQDVAVNIASKAVGMFRKLNVPILGVVGNMDAFACPNCGVQTPIFTRGGSEAAAAKLEVPFLGSIPLDPQTVEHGDLGTPTVVAAPDSPQAEAFRRVARNLVAQVTAAKGGDEGGLTNLFGRFQR